MERRVNELYYGFGERAGPLNKYGRLKKVNFVGDVFRNEDENAKYGCTCL